MYKIHMMLRLRQCKQKQQPQQTHTKLLPRSARVQIAIHAHCTQCTFRLFLFRILFLFFFVFSFLLCFCFRRCEKRHFFPTAKTNTNLIGVAFDVQLTIRLSFSFHFITRLNWFRFIPHFSYAVVRDH